uniref:Cuticle protein 6 n=1 Tax=Cacopsylla melanoneura TaxID=428564 RepID=A0A8D8Q7J7_9HEMI
MRPGSAASGAITHHDQHHLHHQHHLHQNTEPDSIYAPVQQLSPVQHQVLSDQQYQQYPVSAGGGFVNYPAGVQGTQAGYNDYQYDPNVSSDSDTVEVTAAKIFADHIPRPVQDTPEVTAARVQHMAALQQAIANNQHNGNKDYIDSYDDGSYSELADATRSDSSPLSALATPPQGYVPFGHPQYQLTPSPASPVIRQYHRQDELGQYSYGYSGGPSAKTEVKTLDGVTRGSYSYIDARGEIQHVNYIADPANGFRVAASNLPVGPTAATPLGHETNSIAETPEVARAKSLHFAAVHERIKLQQQHRQRQV